MKNKIILLLIGMFIFMQSAISAPFSGNAKTKRIPAGTILSLKMLNSIDTSFNTAGNDFTAMLVTDQKADDNDDVILPMGSIIRGSIRGITPAKRMSKGAVLYLDFDHVVTPSGRQIPLDMTVVQYDKIFYDGGLYKNLGYGEALKNNFDKSKDITVRSTNYGLSVKDDHPGLQFLTTPFCAAGGFIGGVGYFIGDSIADMFRKGQDVYIKKGEIINVTLVNPIDIPVY